MAALAVVGREVARLEEEQAEAARELWELAAARGTPANPNPGLRGELEVLRAEAAAVRAALAGMGRRG